MEVSLNADGQVSVFRRAVKRTHKGVHVGVVGDFENTRSAKNEIYLWSCIKRRLNHKSLFKAVFKMGVPS